MISNHLIQKYLLPFPLLIKYPFHYHKYRVYNEKQLATFGHDCEFNN